MVLRICRTILRGQHDAEDAFQATFLVLARQAASIRRPGSVASWLHGVARRVASSARRAASRRRKHERKAALLATEFVAEPRWDDLARVLHQEIDQLPERKKEILDLMHAWSKAIVKSDVATMDRLPGFELVGTDPVGCLWDKAKCLEHVKTNAFHVESTEFKETKIDVYGDAAVETGVALSKVNGNRPPYVAERGYIMERLTRT